MNTRHFFGISLMTFAIATAFGCELKKTNTIALITKVVPTEKKEDNNTVKIALLLDTSNSMDGLINQAKAQLWDIVNKFSYAKCGTGNRPKLEIALYQYGNDRLSSKVGYVEQVLGFSTDLDEISEKLFSLTTKGGEEFCGKAIETSLQQLDWGNNPDHLKMIFIAGNEPFTQGKLNYKTAVTHAKEKEVIVNTIFCGDYEQGIQTAWKNGAKMTGGDYIAIDHNQEVTTIATPYDNIIIELNAKLNNTYISYGKLGATKMKMQRTQDTNAMSLKEDVAIKRAVSKSSRLYKNSSWDLVDANDDKAFDIATVSKEDLPVELKDKSPSELQSYIENKKIARTNIQKEIQELHKKRMAYIVKNKQENTQGVLKDALFTAIKKQALKKNYRWE